MLFRIVAGIPNPKDAGGGYVSDPQNLLSGNECDSLNAVLKELDTKMGVEAAVVIIRDFDPDQDDFTFATALFRHWSIGKHETNNGLLLLIATDRRQYRFISGYCLEGLLPDAALARIGEQILMPEFKEQAYGEGNLKAMQKISRYLQQPANKKELNSLIATQTLQSRGITTNGIWLILVIVASMGADWQIRRFKLPYLQSKQSTSNIYEDISGWSTLLLVGIICFIGILGFFFGKLTDILTAIPKVFPLIVCKSIITYFFFAHLGVLSKLRKHFKDDVNYFDAVADFISRHGGTHCYHQSCWSLFLYK